MIRFASTVATLALTALTIHAQAAPKPPAVEAHVATGKPVPALAPALKTAFEADALRIGVVQQSFAQQAQQAIAPLQVELTKVSDQIKAAYPGYHAEFDPQTLSAHLVADTQPTPASAPTTPAK